MKIKLFALIGMIVLLGACGAKEKTYKCKLDVANIPTKIDYTYKAKGDKITYIKLDQEIKVSETGISEADLKVEVDKVKVKYDKVKNLVYNTEIKDGKFTEEIIIDVNKVKMTDLVDIGLVTKVDDKEPKFISLKGTKTSLEAQGVVCEK